MYYYYYSYYFLQRTWKAPKALNTFFSRSANIFIFYKRLRQYVSLVFRVLHFFRSNAYSEPVQWTIAVWPIRVRIVSPLSYKMENSCFDQSCPTKECATIPSGIMGRKSLALVDWSSRCWATKKAKAEIYLFVLFPSLSLKHLNSQSRNHEPPLPIIPFDIVAYGFVGQPFSKQLYIKPCLNTLLNTIREMGGVDEFRGVNLKIG